MYMQAAATASFDRPFKFLPSWTVLKSLLALSVMVLVRLILSAILEMVLKALMRVLSELLLLLAVRLLLYRALPVESKLAGPVLGPIMVERSPPPRREFSAPPTRDLSSPPASLENVLHSEPTSMTLSPATRPHWEQIWSPVMWSSIRVASGIGMLWVSVGSQPE